MSATTKQKLDLKALVRILFPQIGDKWNLIMALLCGGAFTTASLYVLEKWQKASQQYDAPNGEHASSNFVKRKVAVNRVFLQRLWHIVRIIMPSWKSAEFVHLLILTGLSTIRTLLSIEVADVTGTSSIDFTFNYPIVY
jgi:hypothetical protein